MSLHHQRPHLVGTILLSCLLTIQPAFCGADTPPVQAAAQPFLSLTAYQQPDTAPGVSIGERFTLQCNVYNREDSSLNNQAGSSLGTVWLKDKRNFAANGALQLGQVMLDVRRTTMTRSVEGQLEIDTLNITNIQLSDAGNYTCQLLLFENGVQSTIQSASSNLKILSSPTAAAATLQTLSSPTAATRNMVCNTSNTLVPIGDVIALSCQVDTNGQQDQITVLYWTLEGMDKIYEGGTTADPTSNTAKTILHFVMSTEFNNKMFICHVNQTDGAQTQANYETCSVGPLMAPPTTTMPRSMKGFTLIVVVIAGVLFLCCLTCLICYFCCCKRNRQTDYKLTSRIRRFSVKRKRLVPTPSAAAEISEPPHPRPLTGFDESPYYSSVGLSSSGGGHANVKLTSVDRSDADGASYTALQKNDPNMNNDDVVSRASGADIVDEEGYNLVGIGKMASTVTLPSEAKLTERSSSSLKRGFSLGSLSRHCSRQGSRTSSRASTPVNEVPPYYKTLMKNDEIKTLETPYYLSVFPPGAASGDSLSNIDKSKLKEQHIYAETDIDKASSVPKHVGGHKKVERKGIQRSTAPSSTEALATEDGYLTPNHLTLTVSKSDPQFAKAASKSDPKFSNAVYDVFN